MDVLFLLTVEVVFAGSRSTYGGTASVVMDCGARLILLLGIGVALPYTARLCCCCFVRSSGTLF